jgi:hypothetical protein
MGQLFKLTEVDLANQAKRTQLDPTPVARSEQNIGRSRNSASRPHGEEERHGRMVRSLVAFDR